MAFTDISGNFKFHFRKEEGTYKWVFVNHFFRRWWTQLYYSSFQLWCHSGPELINVVGCYTLSSWRSYSQATWQPWLVSRKTVLFMPETKYRKVIWVWMNSCGCRFKNFSENDYVLFFFENSSHVLEKEPFVDTLHNLPRTNRLLIAHTFFTKISIV